MTADVLSADGGGFIRIRLDVMLAERQMSNAELADRIGIHVNNVLRLRRGDISFIRLETLMALCRELKCQPGDLLEYRTA